MFWGQLNTSGVSVDTVKQRVDVVEMSKGEMYLAACVNVLRNVYGYVRSTEAGRPLDAGGQALPLYTYPAIEYLLQFDYGKKTLFEYGAGSSTLFWMNRARRVVSVENNRKWYSALKPHLKPNVELLLEEDDGFPFCIAEYEHQFDVIIIDGAGYRYDCAAQAIKKLAPGGMIVLDNSDWHHRTAELLKQSGLLQVDMSGFKPTEHHTSTTSLFLHREFDFPTLEARQPSFAMGAKRAHSSAWDRPYAVPPNADS